MHTAKDKVLDYMSSLVTLENLNRVSVYSTIGLWVTRLCLLVLLELCFPENGIRVLDQD